jgi:hypothetical protein
VSVWLCETHGNDRFLTQNDGTIFAQRLAAMWLASGALTARRDAALRAHVRAHSSVDVQAELPGSYSWPQLRREAERRFAAGDDPREVITELRGRHADCPAMAPSVRTMRRWYTQARWLTVETPGKARRRAARAERLPIPAQYMLIPYAMTQHLYGTFYKRPRGSPETAGL